VRFALKIIGLNHINSIILQNGTNFERPLTRQKTRRNFRRIGGLLQWFRRVRKTNQHTMFQRRQPKHQFLIEIPQKNRLGKGKSRKFILVRFETKEEKRLALNSLIQKYSAHIIPAILNRFESR